MHVVTLLTAPEGAPLDPALVESLRNAWGGGEAVWLAPDEAAEFAVPERPDNADHVWSELQMLGVDLAVQPEAGRRKRLLLADMDSTMIRQECVDELAAEAGVGERVAAITARAMNGELGFEGALRERVALLEGLDAGVIGRVLESRIEPMPGGATLVATMKAAGARTVLVSGGFTAFTEVVAGWLGFDAHRANRLCVADGRLTGTVAEPILGRDAKVAVLREEAAALGGPEAGGRGGRRGQRPGDDRAGGAGRGAARQARGAGAGAGSGEPRRPDGAAFPARLCAGRVRQSLTAGAPGSRAVARALMAPHQSGRSSGGKSS